jgi:hypothetical protein
VLALRPARSVEFPWLLQPTTANVKSANAKIFFTTQNTTCRSSTSTLTENRALNIFHPRHLAGDHWALEVFRENDLPIIFLVGRLGPVAEGKPLLSFSFSMLSRSLDRAVFPFG